MKVEQTFIADDGNRFSTAKECRKYEKAKKMRDALATHTHVDVGTTFCNLHDMLADEKIRADVKKMLRVMME